jgi:hypothetical protein
MTSRPDFIEDFDGPGLDRSVWLPHYLPVWSYRETTEATYAVHDSSLHLSIPPDQGLWCGEDHHPPLRVSGIMSGNFSGPVGSTIGQQPFLDGQTVREEQKEFWGWTPSGGRIELRARAVITPRSMVSLWMVGRETVPNECAEIGVMEVFGDALVPGESAAVGMGLHCFRDPGVTEDFEAVRLPIDVAEPHTYAVTWNADEAAYEVDGQVIRRTPRPPSYPMQLMLAVFDFPERSVGDDDHLTPEFVVDQISSST